MRLWKTSEAVESIWDSPLSKTGSASYFQRFATNNTELLVRRESKVQQQSLRQFQSLEKSPGICACVQTDRGKKEIATGLKQEREKENCFSQLQSFSLSYKEFSQNVGARWHCPPWQLGWNGSDQSKLKIERMKAGGVDSQPKKKIVWCYVIYFSVSSVQRRRDDVNRGSGVPKLRKGILA